MTTLERNAFVALLLVLGWSVRSVEAQDTVHVVVVATTDVHGHVYHWDYVNDREAPWGLTRVATVVDSLRRTYAGRVVVLDVGDLIQGNPFAAFYATTSELQPNPVVDALNAVGYDVATPGNHDFNFGLDFMGRALSGAAFPIVSGNIYRLPRDTLAFPPYVILQRGDVRVGVAGFTTPGVMVWDRQNVSNGAVVRRIPSQARKVLRQLDLAGADLKIVAIHSGLNFPSSYDTTGIGAENVAATLARMPVKPDLVVVGHSHARITDSVIGGVHFIQPAPWARTVAVAHVWLVGERGAGRGEGGGRFRVARIAAEQVPLADVAPHPVVTLRLEKSHQAVRTWVSTPLATAQGDWSARYARAEDTPIIDLVNEVQRRSSGAQLSATAAFNPNAGFRVEAVTVRDVAGLYPYDNTLKAVRIDGRSLHRYLERSAAYFRTYRPGQPIINDSVPGYNFDIVTGVNYFIDLTRPAGSRIRQLTWSGRLVLPTDTFTLALNSYRQGGGGGFSMLRGLPVVYDRGENIRDLVTDWVRRSGFLRTEDYFERSWRIIPREAEAAVLAAFQPSDAMETPPPVPARADSVSGLFAFPVEREPPRRPPPPAARLKFPLKLEEGEHPLGRLVADGLRNGARAQFAIVLYDAIRTGLPSGPVSRDQLEAVLGPGERLVRLSIPGDVLYTALDHIVAEGQPNAHVAGLEVWYDAARRVGRRISSVRFPDGRAVRRNRTYTLAVTAPLADGAAGFDMLQGIPLESTGKTDIESLVAYLPRLRQPVEAPSAARFHSTR